MLDIAKDFPLLVNYNKEGRLVYADSAATTQKPQCVLDALIEWYTARNANPHRGTYKLGSLATDIYEYARGVVAGHINAKNTEVVFCRNTTEAINLVARCFAEPMLEAGDEIVLPISEHHSNVLPWQQLARKRKCRLVYLLTDKRGRLLESEIESKIGPKTKIVTMAQVSNMLGTHFPVARVAERAHEMGAYVVADCAQGLLHCGIDVEALGVDFAAFSAHKAFGPDGVGVLWGRSELLKAMPPFLLGGEMVKQVSWGDAVFEKPPLRFEAGTQNASGSFGFSVALKYIEQLGRDAIRQHEAALTERLLEGIRGIPALKIYGNPDYADDRCGIVSFNFLGQSPMLVGRYLDSRGINVRAGTHCTQPLLAYLGIGASCRISFAPYNTLDDVDWIIDALKGGPEMVVKSVLRRTK